MPAAQIVKPAKALKLLAGLPEIEAKTPNDLFGEARSMRRDANRLDAIGAKRTRCNHAQAHQAVRLRTQADIVLIAAREIERRGARTVAEAFQPRRRIVAFFRNLWWAY